MAINSIPSFDLSHGIAGVLDALDTASIPLSKNLSPVEQLPLDSLESLFSKQGISQQIELLLAPQVADKSSLQSDQFHLHLDQGLQVLLDHGEAQNTKGLAALCEEYRHNSELLRMFSGLLIAG